MLCVSLYLKVSSRNEKCGGAFYPIIPDYFLYPFTEEAAARPKLKLAPRTVKEPVNAPSTRSSIFGTGKPRDEKEYEKKKQGDKKDAPSSATDDAAE